MRQVDRVLISNQREMLFLLHHSWTSGCLNSQSLFLNTTTPAHFEDISISPSINTGIAGDQTQANHYAQTYALTLSAIGTPTKIFVILRTNIIVDCEPTEC